MKSRFLMLVLVAACLASCSTVRHTSTAVPVGTTIVSYTVADVNVSPQKISCTTSWSYNPFKRVSVETIKSNTTAKMLMDAKADVLVEPEYIIEQRGLMRGGSVTVIGFPATYTNFHKMTSEEAEVFKAVKADERKSERKKRFFFF